VKNLGLKVPSPETVHFILNVLHEEERPEGRLPHHTSSIFSF